jgi:hypothetical protein
MTSLKIYSTAPNGNQAADTEHAIYMNLAIAKLHEEAERLETADMGVQVMLAHIDILLHLAKKFEQDAQLLIKTKDVVIWETSFNAWFERSKTKIPVKFRNGIRENANALFAELASIAN